MSLFLSCAAPSWSHSTPYLLGRARLHRPVVVVAANRNAAHRAVVSGSPPVAPEAPVVSTEAFGSLVDMARLQMGSPSAEICDACNTINIGSARRCKCCAHKLPAFYGTLEGTKRPEPRVLLWQALGLSERASVMDFAAFSVVINVLMVITASIPIR